MVTTAYVLVIDSDKSTHVSDDMYSTDDELGVAGQKYFVDGKRSQEADNVNSMEDQQSEEPLITNLQPVHVKDLFAKLSQVEDKNVYIFAEEIEISSLNIENISNNSESSEVTSAIKSVTELASALIGLATVLLSYPKNKRGKSSSKPNKQPLIKIDVGTREITISHFDEPEQLAPDIQKQLGIKPVKVSNDEINEAEGITVFLEPDVAASFPNSIAANNALRGVLRVVRNFGVSPV